MIAVGSLLHISDNSGALSAKCIKVIGTTNPLKKGKVGDIIVVTLVKVKSAKKISAHQIKKALLIGCRYPTVKSSGVHVSSPLNTIILLDDRLSPLGNRINSYTLSNLRFKNYMKVVSLSFGVI